MNEVLQRRLIGALVLLAAAFLLASLLPDPSTPPAAMRRDTVSTPEPLQVVTYDLQTGAPVGLKLDPKLKTQTPAIKAPATPEKQDPELPAEHPAPTVVEPKPAASGAAGWTVQIGSFGDPDNAEGARKSLRQAGLNAVVQEVRVGRALWYRVRLGPFSDEARAKSALDKAVRQGFHGAKLINE